MDENEVKKELTNEEVNILPRLIGQRKDLASLCLQFNVNELTMLGYLSELKESGKNIFVSKENGIYFINYYGDQNIEKNEYKINDFKDKSAIKFGFLSDTGFGSKSQQLSIVNDFYTKAIDDFGVDFFVHSGDISAGKYLGQKSIYNNSLFAHGAYEQADIIASQYPYISGIKTYFITGEKDQSHMRGKDKQDVGKLIGGDRDDLVYLGLNNCHVSLNNLKIYIDHKVPKLAKQNQQLSYRPQRTIATMRSEDKVDMLLQGHSFHQQAFRMRDIECITAPSMMATTPEMRDYEISNSVGAWIIYLEIVRGKIDKIRKLAIPYYVTREDDYLTAKRLVRVRR